MRVLIFSLAYLPYVGGAEVAAREICERLPADFEMDLVTLRFDKKNALEEKMGRVNVYRVGYRSKYFFIFQALKKALGLHKKKPYDFIWSIMANYAGFAALFFKILRPKTPFLLTLQEGDPIPHIKKRVGIFYPVFRQIFKRADVIQAISRYLANFGEEMGFSGRARVVPNGVDLARFSKEYPQSEIEELRDKLDKLFKSRGRYLISVSRLVVKNGLDDCLRALALLPQDMRLLILGTGPLESDLKSLSTELGVDHRVLFLGNIGHDLLPLYLKASHIFIRPSLSEGLGNAFLEAMAAGVPIIGSSVGGIPDFLKDKETGLFCGVKDPEDLSQKIRLLFENKELREKITGKAKELVLQKYNWQSVTDDMRHKVFRPLTQKNPEIAMAATILPPEIGGPALHASELITGLKDQGFKIQSVSYTSLRKWPFGLRHLIYFWRLVIIAKKSDIIYAHDLTASGLPTVLVKKLFGKKMVLRIGGDILWERISENEKLDLSMNEFYSAGLHKGRFLFKLGRFVLRNSDILILPALTLATVYQEYYGVGVSKMVIIPNPLPLVKASEAGDGSILFAGRFVRYKNLERLIKAFKSVSLGVDKAQLLLIGDGPDKNRLKALSDNHPKIRMLGRVSRTELAHYLEKASVCVAPALTEFSPNFALEALAHGKPILLSRENGLGIDLPEEMLFYPKNEEELWHKLSWLLTNELRVSMPTDRTWQEVMHRQINLLKNL